MTTEWKAGSVVEAAWATVANHGGGYSYRLCKLTEEGATGLTEDCFQRTPLNFASDRSWVQFGWDDTSRITFKVENGRMKRRN